MQPYVQTQRNCFVHNLPVNWTSGLPERYITHVHVMAPRREKPRRHLLLSGRQFRHYNADKACQMLHYISS